MAPGPQAGILTRQTLSSPPLSCSYKIEKSVCGGRIIVGSKRRRRNSRTRKTRSTHWPGPHSMIRAKTEMAPGIRRLICAVHWLAVGELWAAGSTLPFTAWTFPPTETATEGCSLCAAQRQRQRYRRRQRRRGVLAGGETYSIVYWTAPPFLARTSLQIAVRDELALERCALDQRLARQYPEEELGRLLLRPPLPCATRRRRRRLLAAAPHTDFAIMYGQISGREESLV